MFKFLGVFFFVLLFFFLVGVIVVVYYIRKGMKFMRRMATGEGMTKEEFERMSNKHYKADDDEVHFDDNYFKGTSRKTGTQQQQQRRTTRTSSGVTIIDDRDPNQANKKIFAHDEGEYVDFTEN